MTAKKSTKKKTTKRKTVAKEKNTSLLKKATSYINNNLPLSLLSFVFVLSIMSILAFGLYSEKRGVDETKFILTELEEINSAFSVNYGLKTTYSGSCSKLQEKFSSTPICFIYIEQSEKVSDDLKMELGEVMDSIDIKLNDVDSCNKFSTGSFTFSNSDKLLYSCQIISPSTSTIEEIEKYFF